MKKLIEARNLHKTFSQGRNVYVHALNGVNLDVFEGEFLGIFGPSGAGKSTLLHVLSTNERPSSGSLKVFGLDPSHLDDNTLSRLRNERMGFVFQFPYFVPELTVLENVILTGMINPKTSYRELKERGMKILDELGLQNKTHHLPKELSGGELQRASIARSLINNPDILFLDEPTGNLDSENTRKIFEILKKINEDLGKTILLVSHNPLAKLFTSRRLYMLDGRVYDEESAPIRI